MSTSSRFVHISNLMDMCCVFSQDNEINNRKVNVHTGGDPLNYVNGRK